MSDAISADVSIIVVSYNTRAFTLEALRSVMRETREARLELIVVDNASEDGSAEAIRREFPAARLIALDQNIGFGRANNLGAEHASGDYVLLLNPDTVVIDRAIDRLIGFARGNRRALIWGGRTLFPDGRLNPASCWRRITPWNLVCRALGLTGLFPRSALFNSEAYGGWARDRVREVDIVSGCFLMIPRPLWLALGGFDPRFFMYGEEADLCLRARRIGARPMVTPEATIVHIGGASERARTGKMIRLLAAKATLIERHWSPVVVDAGQALLACWPLSRLVVARVAARIAGAPQMAEAAATWGEIWQRRAEWRYGYAKPEPIAIEREAQRPLLARGGAETQGEAA